MADGALVLAQHALVADVTQAINERQVNIYSYDPPEAQTPAVTVSTGPTSPTEWSFLVRLYVDAGQSEEAQALLGNLITDLDDGLSAAYARSEFTEEYDEKKAVWVTQSVVRVGREDF